jgi:hypothetical protein
MLLSESRRAVARRDGDALHRPGCQHMDVALPDLMVLGICNGGLYRFGPGSEP